MKNNTPPSELLVSTLAERLEIYHSPTARYRHLAFSSKELTVLDEVADALRSLLPGFTVWHGVRPESAALPTECSRSEFIAEVFDAPRAGLIIVDPHYWWLSWHITEKQAFWSAFNARYGGHQVIVVFREGNEFNELNQNYVIGHELPGLPVTLWRSSKADLMAKG